VGDIIRTVRNGRFLGFYVRYKDVDGRRKVRASHQPTRELARRYLVEIEARVARGLLGLPEPPPPVPTVRELSERFLTEYSRPRIKDLSRYRSYARTALRRALPRLGGLAADQVTAAALQRLRDELGQRRAAASVRLTLSFLGVMFAWAVRQKLLPTNPLRGVELPARRELTEYLSGDEVRALLAAAARRAAEGTALDRLRHTCLAVALHTGLRRGELLGLRWRDIDLQARRLTVARSYGSTPKADKPRHLRLPQTLVPLLTAWAAACPPTAEGLVFPLGSAGRPRAAAAHHKLDLSGLCTEAGCRPLARPWHALRHTFASHYVMQGGSLLALQQILGHSDIKMTLVYAHLAPDFLDSEMDRLKF
jgi:integrase